MTGDIAHHVDPDGGREQDDRTLIQDRNHAVGAPENLDELIAVAHGEKDDVGTSGSFLCAGAGRREVRGGAAARSVDVIASDRERLSKVASHGQAHGAESEHGDGGGHVLSLIHISEPTRLLSISYAVFCL